MREPDTEPDEQAAVDAWRLRVLLDADYPLGLAERIAATNIDLHQAVQLIRDGCSPRTAAKILL